MRTINAPEINVLNDLYKNRKVELSIDQGYLNQLC